jgi:hypothetical protein
MEVAFGADFGSVRVRIDESLDRPGARAMTSGEQIRFAPGRYAPATPAGRRLLAHELAHVLQQRQGVRAGDGAPGDPHEREAARAADVVAAGGRHSPAGGPPAPAVQFDQGPADAPLAEKLPGLVPPPVPELPPETDDQRVTRIVNEGRTTPRPVPPDNVADGLKALLRRCTEDQKLAAVRDRPAAPSSAGLPPIADPMAEVQSRIEACMATPEGERFTALAKEAALSTEGLPFTFAIEAGSFALTGSPLVIPKITIGDAVVLSLDFKAKAPVYAVSATLSVTPAAQEAVGRGVVGGARAVGGALARFGSWLWGGVTSAASATWDAAKAAGRAIGRAADAVWNGVTWVAGQIWDKATGVFERVGHLLGNLPARIGRLVLGLWEGVRSLRPWALDWWASLGSASTWLGLLKWLGARLIDLIEIAGVGEAYETIQDFVKFNSRKLDGAEQSAAKLIFGSSIDLELVRVDERAVLGPAFSHREYTSFHTINGWGPIAASTMIHELTHVWQYESAGAIYMPQALHAQIAGEGYGYGGAAGLTARKNAGQGFDSLNREQQASIVEHFSTMHRSDPDSALYAEFVAAASTLSATELIANLPP